MTPDVPASPLAEPAPRRIRFGIVLLPNFTLTAFSGFVDMLRLSADDGDYSKPVRCAWSVIGETLAPVRASCGIQITPWETFDAAEPFDYVVVVGGLLHSGPQAGPETLDFIRRAAAGGATVVGICTGVFTLMRAGVLDGYRTCVSWFHYWDFIERFPAADPDLLIADRLFVIDRRRITCSGGRASIDVAAAILLRHFDHATVQKALRILLVGEMQKGNAPQPHPPGLEPATHPKVKRAILLMEQHVGRALPLEDVERIAAANPSSVVVIDEAYVDFGAQSAITLIDRHPNLLVVHTTSKARSLAGMRVGFAFGDAALIDALNRVKDSFNSYPLDRLAQAAAQAAYEDTDYFDATCRRVIDSRTRLTQALDALGFDVVPSAANFVFARHPAHDAGAIAAKLKEREIFVRHFRLPRIDQHLRITVGTDAECDALVAALRELLG